MIDTTEDLQEQAEALRKAIRRADEEDDWSSVIALRQVLSGVVAKLAVRRFWAQTDVDLEPPEDTP